MGAGQHRMNRTQSPSSHAPPAQIPPCPPKKGLLTSASKSGLRTFSSLPIQTHLGKSLLVFAVIRYRCLLVLFCLLVTYPTTSLPFPQVALILKSSWLICQSRRSRSDSPTFWCTRFWNPHSSARCSIILFRKRLHRRLRHRYRHRPLRRVTRRLRLRASCLDLTNVPCAQRPSTDSSIRRGTSVRIQVKNLMPAIFTVARSDSRDRTN